MDAARILEEEHKVILTVLEVLSRAVATTRLRGVFPTGDAAEIIRFFQEFADKCHHAKEEDTLFPAMEANGFPRDSGPTAVMRQEHVMGRQMVAAMKAVMDRAAAGDLEAVAIFCARASEFIQLLGQHIQKEDHCLFPMACSAIRNPNHQCDVLARFRQIESDAGGNRHREFLDAAAVLCRRYDVVPVSEGDLPITRATFLEPAAG